MCLGLRSLFLLLMICAPLRAEAGQQNCGNAGRSATLAPLAVSGRYDPTSTTNTVVNGTLQFSAPAGLGPCQLWLTYADQGAPTQLTGPGGAKLSYGETEAFWNLDFATLNAQVDGNGVVEVPPTGTFVFGAGQHVASGTYTGQRIVKVGPSGQTFSQSTVTISVTVNSACSLPAPSASSLDFSGGISGGRVSQGYRLSTVFSGTSCSGPALLTLRGGAMTTALSGAGFRNTIDYAATANFGAASAILTTSSQSQASVALPATSGVLDLGVSLIDGGVPLVAGNYSGTVSVVLEPSN